MRKKRQWCRKDRHRGIKRDSNMKEAVGRRGSEERRRDGKTMTRRKGKRHDEGHGEWEGQDERDAEEEDMRRAGTGRGKNREEEEEALK